MHLHLEEIKMDKSLISKVMKGILVSKPSICTLNCLGIVVESFMFLFYKLPIIKKSLFGGVDDIPCILNNNDKL